MRIRTLAKIGAGLALVVGLAAPAAAQGTAGPGTGSSGVLLGAGVSFLHAEDGTGKGFSIDVRKNVYSAANFDVGVLGDFGWHRNSDDSDLADFTETATSFLGGVRITASQLDKVAPFGQFLIGGTRFGASGDFCDEFGCDSETDTTVAFGGGVDVKLNDKWNFRAQIDLFHVMFEGDSQNFTRFMFGVSTRLGGS